MMSNIEIHQIKSPSETEELDRLLWEVLWKPLDLPRNIRNSFKLEGEYLELGARIDNSFIGGLVANWTSPTEVEIRHIAVKPQNQKQSIGTQLFAKLLEHISDKSCIRVHTIARNTSADFFRRLGFSTAPGEPPDHPLFKKQGITFELLEKSVEP
jgi:ribosomal protein S18 acetylase RimI-like enzyme